jgi:rhodanese-related sulfurtransferase
MTSDVFASVRCVIREVDIHELARLADTGIRLFDVREVQEYVAGHIPGSLLVPLSELTGRVDEFRGEGPAYVVCRSGGRSLQACQYLVEAGVEVVNVAGGTLAWLDADYDVVDGESPR